MVILSNTMIDLEVNKISTVRQATTVRPVHMAGIATTVPSLPPSRHEVAELYEIRGVGERGTSIIGESKG
jgi:hypothetical protein